MFTYQTSLQWNGGSQGTVAAAGRPDLTITSPSEFGGRDDAWNPELMLVAAVESCLLLTALSVAARQKLTLAGYASQATGHMEKTPEGLRFTGIEVAVQLKVNSPADAEKAQKLMAIAEKYCPVSNAVKCPVRVTCEVEGK